MLHSLKYLFAKNTKTRGSKKMLTTILHKFRKIITPKFISRIASTLKFNQRCTGKVTGLNFIKMLVAQVSSGRSFNYSNLNTTLSAISNNDINISNQALAEYFYKSKSVQLIKSVFEEIFTFQKDQYLKKFGHLKIEQNTINLFNRILVEDSTTCTLEESLEFTYKGSGGSKCKSSLKINVIHELRTSAIIKLGIAEGRVSDLTFARGILDELIEGDLVLRDLGYFILDTLEEIKNKKAFFISRYKSTATIFLTSDDSKAIDLGRYLGYEYAQSPNQTFDKVVYIGLEKIAVRMVAYKMPFEVANSRRCKAKKDAAKRGYTATAGRLSLCDYVILITNIPQDMVKAEVIGTIYRIRWSIELMFKSWKSTLNLQLSLRGRKATRIECLVYAILIVCLLTTVINLYLKRLLSPGDKEISLDKLIKWLVNTHGYECLVFGSISKLTEGIQNNLRELLAQKRKRKTTIERVVNGESYMDKYAANF